MQIHRGTKLRITTFKYLEEIIRRSDDYPKEINLREQEIINPYRISDENIGGGRSDVIANQTERIATKLVTDRRLSNLQREYDAFRKTFDSCDDNVKEIITMAYIDKPRTKTWDGIAVRSGYSRAQCFRYRDAFILAMAEELGLF